MKRENPNLFGALLLSLWLNTLLCGQAAYWSRLGVLSCPLSAVFVGGVALCFARAWRTAERVRWLRIVLGCLLAGSSALEILRFWRLLESVSPGSQTLLEVCLLLLLPVLYLRRVSAIAQTANVVLTILLLAGVVLVASISADLRLANLQPTPWTAANWLQTLQAQCVLYPEFMLPALWPDQEKRGPHTVVRLAVLGAVFSAGVHVLLELYFGAGLPDQVSPVHAAAQSGSLSIFNRLEWLQLLLWAMLVSIKLALYLYAGVRLLGKQNGKSENNAVGLNRFPLYLAGMLFLCMVWHNMNPESLFAIRNSITNGFIGLVILIGGAQWITSKKLPSA